MGRRESKFTTLDTTIHHRIKYFDLLQELSLTTLGTDNSQYLLNDMFIYFKGATVNKQESNNEISYPVE